MHFKSKECVDFTTNDVIFKMYLMVAIQEHSASDFKSILKYRHPKLSSFCSGMEMDFKIQRLRITHKNYFPFPTLLIRE